MITDRKNIRNKLKERGFPGKLLGYCEQHASFVYRMLNLKTEKNVITRDIVWLNKSWGNWKKNKDIDIEDEWVDDERHTVDLTVITIDNSSEDEPTDQLPLPGTRQF